MAHWCALAGLPKGLTLHGLRKSLGVYLAEAEASTRQMMDVLGHDDIDHAELDSREASQVFPPWGPCTWITFSVGDGPVLHDECADVIAASSRRADA